ncbi:MAG: malate dehydrogenase [Alistipes sp.]|nr:malate dehydrogenase [Alistipes sp.]
MARHACISDSDALRYHSEGRPGKIGIEPTKPSQTQHDLSLAYSPGVAAPARAIAADPDDAYRYTDKGNLVAVVSNGSAVLGLGDIGPLAAKPVMEGKSMLFKRFAGIDAFDIEVDETDPEKIVGIVKAIAPTFGGINLEDIKAPECFEIDRRLREELRIPVIHDDQHGTAIIVAAAVINGAKIAGKELSRLRAVVNGAGAAAIACARMLLTLGIARERIVLCDSRGAVTRYRGELNPQKAEFATSRRLASLAEALHGADLFLGLSKADVLTAEMIRTMADNPIVLALANPDPEIAYDAAMRSRPDLIFATGRSDHPNQVNNVLGFPFLFRGALDVRATRIDEAMKLAAARALAELARRPVPESVLRAYGLEKLEFGRGYLIPKPLDPRLLCTVSTAVARAAMESGAARQPITDWDAYAERLHALTAGGAAVATEKTVAL